MIRPTISHSDNLLNMYQPVNMPLWFVGITKGDKYWWRLMGGDRDVIICGLYWTSIQEVKGKGQNYYVHWQNSCAAVRVHSGRDCHWNQKLCPFTLNSYVKSGYT